MEKEKKISRLKRMLCKLSYSELIEIDKYVQEREKIQSKIEAGKAADKAWSEFLELNIKEGDLVWNITSGMALYRTWQRGDCGAVWCVQPRARKIWVETEYGWVVIRAYDLVGRVSFSMPKCEPVSDSQRALAMKMGNAINEAFGVNKK
jgi:hypothetical protein